MNKQDSKNEMDDQIINMVIIRNNDTFDNEDNQELEVKRTRSRNRAMGGTRKGISA